MIEGWKSGRGQRIEYLYAWIVSEPDGGEGVAAAVAPPVGAMPLVGADRERIESYRSIAQKMHNDTGFPIRLVRFSKRETLDEL